VAQVPTARLARTAGKRAWDARGCPRGALSVERPRDRSDQLRCISTGLKFDIHATARTPDGLEEIDPITEGPPRRVGQPFTLSDPRPRFGVQFSDGRKAITPGSESRHLGPNAAAPVGPVLQFDGGGGGDLSTTYTYWLWPLPPPGDLDFVVDWPSRGIPETHAVVKADAFITAAAQTVTLWEESVEG
jgi:hypothetical protein